MVTPSFGRSGGPPSRRGGRTAYAATVLGAVIAAIVLALASSPTLAQGAAAEQAPSRQTAGASGAPKGASAVAGVAAIAAPASPAASAHALVAIDRTPLRAAPREGGAVQAELTQGDLLEVRGQRLDHLQVYDHRRERAGFVRAEALRRVSLQSGEADELLAVLRFLRHTPGQEALGIAYVAAYLRSAGAERIDAEPFDALGTMAERLARRASGARAGDTVAAQLEAVAAYGVRFATLEREGRLHLCYEGDAFRRVLALQPDAGQQARAMLALTRHDCVDPMLTPTARAAHDAWRADLLDLPWPRGYNELPALARNRLHLRRAGLWAARAHQFSRLGRAVQPAAERALAELATVNKHEFTDEDQLEYAEAAIRVGAVRWAAVPQATPVGLMDAGAHGLRLVVRAGAEPGQTCVQLLAAELAAPSTRPVAAAPAGRAAPRDEAGPSLLAERCTFGTVWTRSVAVRPAGDALVLAVQPLEGWTELWVFRAEPSERAATEAGGRASEAVGQGGTAGEPASAARSARAAARPAWRVDVLPPASSSPGLGYVEFAGWVPGAQPRLLIARESRIEGRFHRRFEVLALDTLDPVKQASTPNLLVAFGQWSDAQWRRRTVALR
ncbi:MAG: hypothetical protein JNN03_20570 [Rubrivivax sp.]|nr:hypothetical protein [Rubrivivax sp.]